MATPYDYDEAKALLGDIINGFEILSGDKVGDINQSWQDHAVLTSVHLLKLSNRLVEANEGNCRDFPTVFPSPNDLEVEQ